jgi:hypothetical protein
VGILAHPIHPARRPLDGDGRALNDVSPAFGGAFDCSAGRQPGGTDAHNTRSPASGGTIETHFNAQNPNHGNDFGRDDAIYNPNRSTRNTINGMVMMLQSVV